MGYQLKGILGKEEDIEPLLSKYRNAKTVSLNQEFSIVPMIDELFDEINDFDTSASIADFVLLTPKIEQELVNCLPSSTFAYVESDFFGGQGGHQGIVWTNGERLTEQSFSQHAMNKILDALGVKVTIGQDAFISIGLDLHKNTGEWFE